MTPRTLATLVAALPLLAAAPALAQQGGDAARPAAQNQDDLRLVQQKLKQMGIYQGPVDGVDGPETRAAVERFQQGHGIQPSGDVTPPTLAALAIGKTSAPEPAQGGADQTSHAAADTNAAPQPVTNTNTTADAQKPEQTPPQSAEAAKPQPPGATPEKTSNAPPANAQPAKAQPGNAEAGNATPTPPPASPQTPAPPSASTAAAKPPPGAAGTLSRDDLAFARAAASSGAAEVAAGHLALSKAASQQARKFAQMLVDDHMLANEELRRVAQANGIPLQIAPTQSQQEQLHVLEGLNGPAFDRAFAGNQVTDHELAIALFEREAQSGTDEQLRSFAEKTLPTLQQHLQMARAVLQSG